MAATWDTVVLEVGRLAKMNSTYNSENISVIQDAILRAQYDLAREQPERMASLKVPNTVLSLTGAATGATILLPTTFIRIDQVSYSASGFKWQLTQRDLRIPPAKVFGRPRAYTLIQPTGGGAPYGLILDPSASIDETHDVLSCDFYTMPTVPTFGVAAPFMDTINYAEIVRRATMYCFLYTNRIAEAQFLQQLQTTDMPANTADTTPTPQVQ